MRSQVSTQRQWQTPIRRGGCGSVPPHGGGFRPVSIGGGCHFRVLRASQAKGTALSPIELKSSAFPLSPIPPLHSLSSSSPPPWLLFPSSYFSHLDQNQDLLDHYPYCFVSPSDNKVFRLDKTQVQSQRILPWDREFCFPSDAEIHGGSPLGWILVHHPRTLQLFLMNPLFPSDSIFLLPSFFALDRTLVAGSVSKSCIWSDHLVRKYMYWEEIENFDLDSDDEPEMHHIVEDESRFCPRFAMSSVPSDPSCIVMLAQNSDILHFWKHGQKSWTQVDVPTYSFSNNIVYSNASECFYAVDGPYLDAWKWDSNFLEPQRTLHFEVDIDSQCNRYHDSLKSNQWIPRNTYLVHSSSGNLLLVRVLFNEDRDGVDTPSLQFFVFKLRFDQHKWEHVKSLGEDESAIFVGENCAFCVPVADYPELRANCIYYGGDESYTVPLDVMVVFNMEDESINRYRFTSDHGQSRRQLSQYRSIWVLPNPNF